MTDKQEQQARINELGSKLNDLLNEWGAANRELAPHQLTALLACAARAIAPS